MAKELHETDNILRTKVLIEINEDFHRADLVVQSLTSSLLKELIISCAEEDNTRRELASSAVMKVAGTEAGRQRLIDDDYVKNVATLLRDKLPQIRANAYHALLFAAEYRAGYEAVVRNDLLHLLVDLLKEEKEDKIIVLALMLLRLLTEAEVASKVLLKTEVLDRLNEHLKSADLEVRRQSTLNVCALSFKLKGKKKIILCKSRAKANDIIAGTIPTLCKLLQESDEALLTAVTKALASLANKKKGKVQVILRCDATTHR